MKIGSVNTCTQANMDFYKYVSARLTDILIDMYSKAICSNIIDDPDDTGIGAVIGSLEGLKMTIDSSFSTCMCDHNSDGVKLYDIIVERLDAKLKSAKNPDFISSFEFAKKLLHDIAKEGGFLK